MAKEKKILTPEELAIKAKQSATGKSNVRRSKCHERTIANWMTDWSGVEFRRRRVEGRDSTVIERESTADIIAVKGDIYCSIEAKCGEVASFASLLNNPKGTKFTEWWHQTCYDCILCGNVFKRHFYPMMFFRPYPNQNWVAISSHLFTNQILKSKILGLQLAGIWFPHFAFDAYSRLGEISFNVVKTKKKENFKFVPLQLDPIIMCRWEDFAANIDPQSFFLNPIPGPQSYSEQSEVTDGVRRLRETGNSES